MTREEVKQAIINGSYLYDITTIDEHKMEAIYKPEKIHDSIDVILSPMSWWSDGWSGRFQNGKNNISNFRLATDEEVQRIVFKQNG